MIVAPAHRAALGRDQPSIKRRIQVMNATSVFTRGVCAALVTSVFILASACGKDSDGDDAGAATGKFAGKDYVVLEQGDLAASEAAISGSGTIAFKDPVGELGAKKDYALTFTLEDGGSLDLVAQADEKLEHGVGVSLRRTGAALSVVLAADGEEAAAKTLAGVDAAAAMTLHIDVHNDESPAHVLVWSGTDFSEDAAALNSEADGATPGQGDGTFWGLRLMKASVTAADVGGAEFVE
jgi:hypothetical protein